MFYARFTMLGSRLKPHPALSALAAAAAAVTLVSASAPAAEQAPLAAAMDRMHHAMATPATGDFDVDFARMMVAHHEGAIDMAKLQLVHGSDPRLRRLAQKIIIEQSQEIRTMTAVLESRALSSPASAAGTAR